MAMRRRRAYDGPTDREIDASQRRLEALLAGAQPRENDRRVSSFRIELPLPPTANNAYPANKTTGRRYLSARAKRWKIEAGWMIRAARPPAITGAYTFQIAIPFSARGDTDGYIKLPQDLLVELGVTPDDRKAVESYGTRSHGIPPRRCVIVVADAP